MELSDILKPEAVKTFAQAASKKRVLQDLSELAASVYGVNGIEVFDALQDRENLGSTGVGQGVAIPHARLENIESVIGLFIRLEKPMDFESSDRQPVDLVFALLAPENAGVDHLKALALVSRSLRNSAVQAKLRSNDVNGTLHAILTESAPSKAA